LTSEIYGPVVAGSGVGEGRGGKGVGDGGFQVGSIMTEGTGLGVDDISGVMMGFVSKGNVAWGVSGGTGVGAAAGNCPRDRSIDPKNRTITAAMTASTMTAALTLRKLFMLVTPFGG
jgi:hypothetical protein